MATALAQLSLQEYLRTNYKPDVDFVDGTLEERNMGEQQHAQLQWLIAELLGQQCKQLQVRGLIEQRIKVAPDRVRVCDVVLRNAKTPYDKVLSTPPLVCIEILSPEDRLSRATLVLSDYQRMGVPNIWLIDPIRRCAYTFDGSGLHPELGSALMAQGIDLSLDLDALFAEFVDEPQLP